MNGPADGGPWLVVYEGFAAEVKHTPGGVSDAIRHADQASAGNVDVRVFSLPLVDELYNVVGALRALVEQHERPHGFDDSHWYEREVNAARAILDRLPTADG